MAAPVVELLYGSPVLFPQDPFYGVLYSGQLQPATATKIVYETPDGTLIFKGEFTVDGMGIVTGGTVENFIVREGRTKVMTGSGYDMSATDLIDAIAAWQLSNQGPLSDLFLDIPTRFIGSEMDDFFYIGGSGSVARGRQGNDTFIAFVVDVKLKGGKGNDMMLTEDGQCWFSGGKGNDVFGFAGPTASTTIADFSVDDDLIMLNPFAFAGVDYGFLDPDQFKVGKQASTPEQIILYQKGKGRIFFDEDGSGDLHDPIQFARVNKGLDLSAKHFYGEVGGIA